MRDRLTLCLILVIMLGLSLVLTEMPFAQPPQLSPDPMAVSITTGSLSALTGENWDARRSAAEALRDEHRKRIESLIEIVERNDEANLSSPRTLAAQLLGEWGAIAAVPTLTSKLDYKVPIVVTTSSRFHMEAFPCAAAIAEMGPSALKPTLKELSSRDAPLTLDEKKVAAYLIVALCDHSADEAIKRIADAERVQKGSSNLAPVRKYVEDLLEQKNRLEPDTTGAKFSRSTGATPSGTNDPQVPSINGIGPGHVPFPEPPYT